MPFFTVNIWSAKSVQYFLLLSWGKVQCSVWPGFPTLCYSEGIAPPLTSEEVATHLWNIILSFKENKQGCSLKLAGHCQYVVLKRTTCYNLLFCMDQLTEHDVNNSTEPTVSFVNDNCNKIHKTKWEDCITLLSLTWMDRNI